MNVTYEHKPEMTLIGFSTSIRRRRAISNAPNFGIRSTAGSMQSPDYECGIWVPICKPIEQNECEAAETVSTMMATGIL